MVAAEKTQTAKKAPSPKATKDTDPKGNPDPSPAKKASVKTDKNGTPNVIEAWGLVQSPRGGDLWHAVKFELVRKGFLMYAKEVERFAATLKIIAAEHVRDNIDRLKL